MTASKPSRDDPVGGLDTPISDVIRQSDASVRLTNALVHAGNILPFYTVREYLAAGPSAKDKFLTIPNLGRRSADEWTTLCVLLWSMDLRIRWSPFMTAPLSRPGPTSAVSRCGMFSDFRFPNVFLEGAISTRLANALRSNPQLPGRVSDFLR